MLSFKPAQTNSLTQNEDNTPKNEESPRFKIKESSIKIKYLALLYTATVFQEDNFVWLKIDDLETSFFKNMINSLRKRLSKQNYVKFRFMSAGVSLIDISPDKFNEKTWKKICGKLEGTYGTCQIIRSNDKRELKKSDAPLLNEITNNHAPTFPIKEESIKIRYLSHFYTAKIIQNDNTVILHDMTSNIPSEKINLKGMLESLRKRTRKHDVKINIINNLLSIQIPSDKFNDETWRVICDELALKSRRRKIIQEDNVSTERATNLSVEVESTTAFSLDNSILQDLLLLQKEGQLVTLLENPLSTIPIDNLSEFDESTNYTQQPSDNEINLRPETNHTFLSQNPYYLFWKGCNPYENNEAEEPSMLKKNKLGL